MLRVCPGVVLHLQAFVRKGTLTATLGLDTTAAGTVGDGEALLRGNFTQWSHSDPPGSETDPTRNAQAVSLASGSSLTRTGRTESVAGTFSELAGVALTLQLSVLAPRCTWVSVRGDAAARVPVASRTSLEVWSRFSRLGFVTTNSQLHLTLRLYDALGAEITPAEDRGQVVRVLVREPGASDAAANFSAAAGSPSLTLPPGWVALTASPTYKGAGRRYVMIPGSAGRYELGYGLSDGTWVAAVRVVRVTWLGWVYIVLGGGGGALALLVLFLLHRRWKRLHSRMVDTVELQQYLLERQYGEDPLLQSGLGDTGSTPSERTRGFKERRRREEQEERASLEAELGLTDVPVFDYAEHARLLTDATRIGSGSFSEVYKLRYKGELVAVKKARLPAGSDYREIRKAFAREVAIMVRIDHPNVLHAHAASLALPHLCVVTDYMERGSLYRLLHAPGGGGAPAPTLTLGQRLGILYKVARGMEHLHSQVPKVIHRDLSSHNVLIGARWDVRIADFGLARDMRATHMSTVHTAGTPSFMAPEVLRGEEANEKVDVFAFGVIVWETMTQLMPWEGCKYTDVIRMVGLEGRSLPVDAILASPAEYDARSLLGRDQLLVGLRDLAAQCLEATPLARPTFGALRVALQGLVRAVPHDAQDADPYTSLKGSPGQPAASQGKAKTRNHDNDPKTRNNSNDNNGNRIDRNNQQYQPPLLDQEKEERGLLDASSSVNSKAPLLATAHTDDFDI